MGDRVDVRYAERDGNHIAYTSAGTGPAFMVVSNWLTDVESIHDVPLFGRWLDHLATTSQAIWFDQPGTGHSDPIWGDMPSLETYVESVTTVMDAAGVDDAVLIAWDLGVPTALLFAATHPSRVRALIVHGGPARWLADDGYDGLPEAGLDDIIRGLMAVWGTAAYGAFVAPSMRDDAAACEAVARWLRQTLSPGAVRRVYDMALRFDVRDVLPQVRCPVLVMGATHALAAASRAQLDHLAEHLPDARLAVYDSADHLPYQPAHEAWYYDTIDEFLGGRPSTSDIDDRVLTTILFTDIVASTETAASLGDHGWRRSLDAIERSAAEEITRCHGRLVKTTGDGLLATFDGPARAVRCAEALRAIAARLGLRTRTGIHTGEVELRGDDIGGLAVHIASRVMAHAEGDEVVVSSIVRDLVVGSGLEFDDRGAHELRGVPGTWNLLALRD